MSAINSGSLEFINRKELPSNVLAYKRKAGGEEILVVMNFNTQKKEFVLSGNWQLVFGINETDAIRNGKIYLDNFGALVLKHLN